MESSGNNEPGKNNQEKEPHALERQHTWRNLKVTSANSSTHGMKAMEPKPESSIGKAATNISAKILITFIHSTKERQLLYREEKQKLRILFYVHG
jgi:hypothetical protein